MSLFNTVLTPAQNVANGLFNDANSFLNTLIVFYKKNYNVVWNNPRVSPSDVVSAMGTQALGVFTHTAGLASYINSLQSGAVPSSYPANWNVAFGGDGSATATYLGPVITSVGPANASAASPIAVTVSGTNLGSVATVRVDAQDIASPTITANSVSFTLPSGTAMTHNIDLIGPSGSANILYTTV